MMSGLVGMVDCCQAQAHFFIWLHFSSFISQQFDFIIYFVGVKHFICLYCIWGAYTISKHYSLLDRNWRTTTSARMFSNATILEWGTVEYILYIFLFMKLLCDKEGDVYYIWSNTAIRVWFCWFYTFRFFDESWMIYFRAFDWKLISILYLD